MVDISRINELRRLTNAGLADCKRALDQAGGDVFTAATMMLTEEDVQAIQQAVRVRAMAGQSISDPVTPDEQELVDALVAHFVAQRTRPVNVGFLFELAACFHSDPDFRSAITEEPTAAVRKVWRLLNIDDDAQDQPVAVTVEGPQCVSTVVTLPESQSEWECDFIVLQHPRKRFFRSTPPIVLAVYRRTTRTDRGVVNIEQMGVRGDEVIATRRWVLDDAVFEPGELASIGFAPGLQEVTK